MKRLILSAVVVAASVAYSLYQQMGGTSAAVSVAATPSTAAITIETAPAASPQSTPTATQPAQSTAPVATSVSTPTPAPTPALVQKGQYVDGSYTGSAADAYYGIVQVKAVVQGGKLASVSFLQYPSDRSTSRYINSQAMPILSSEAVRAQSANVAAVSGASDTSQAFRESLASALTRAST